MLIPSGVGFYLFGSKVFGDTSETNSDSPRFFIVLLSGYLDYLEREPASRLIDEADSMNRHALLEYKINKDFVFSLVEFNYKPINTKYYGIGVNLNF